MMYNLKFALIVTVSLIVAAPGYCLAENFNDCSKLYKPGTYNDARQCLNNIASHNIDIARATFMLGGIYAEGKGVEPNLVEAYKWFIVSKNFDSINTLTNTMISACERELTELEIKQGRDLAAQWIKRKVNKSYIDSSKQNSSNPSINDNLKTTDVGSNSNKLNDLKSEFSKAQAFEMSKNKSAKEKAQCWFNLSLKYPDEQGNSLDYTLLRAKAIAKAGYWNEVAQSDPSANRNSSVESKIKTPENRASESRVTADVVSNTFATTSGIVSWKTDRSSLNFHETKVVRTKEVNKPSGVATTKFEILNNGKTITEISNDGLDKTFIHRDYPASGFETLVLEVMSRGNGGYCDSLILTHDGVFTHSTKFTNLTLGLSFNNNNYFTTLDNTFSYYTIKAGNKQISLCSACAPYPKRTIIFVGQSWRFDKPGENNKHYTEEFDEAIEKYKKISALSGDNDIEKSSIAILAAYYFAMLNKSELQTREILNQLLPASSKLAVDNILKDIRIAISSIAKKKSSS